MPQHLAGRRFIDVVEWLFCTSQGVVLIGERASERARVCPPRVGVRRQQQKVLKYL